MSGGRLGAHRWTENMGGAGLPGYYTFFRTWPHLREALKLFIPTPYFTNEETEAQR